MGAKELARLADWRLRQFDRQCLANSQRRRCYRNLFAGSSLRNLLTPSANSPILLPPDSLTMRAFGDHFRQSANSLPAFRNAFQLEPVNVLPVLVVTQCDAVAPEVRRQP